MTALLPTLDDIVNEAIINNRPAVIVEGIDDVKIYEKISKNRNRNSLIIPIELIEGYTEGCDGVINANSKIMLMNSETAIPNDLILLIIDKDVRDFRNQIPLSLEFTLVLEHYSFESYFVNPNNFKYILEKTTNANQTLINSINIDFEFSNFLSRTNNLYIASLEALYLSMDQNYQSIFQYSYSIDRIKEQILVDLLSKKTFLEEKAISLGLDPYSRIDYKKIVKGKWLLEFYAKYIKDFLKNIKTYCSEERIPKCSYCASGKDKCFYKPKIEYSWNVIQEFLKEHYDQNEFQKIYDRFDQLRLN